MPRETLAEGTVRPFLLLLQMREIPVNAINDEWSQIAANAIIHAATMGYNQMAQDASLPHVQMRPKLFIDGDQWCALYGENLQDGVAGFGKSPAAACDAFNAAWWEQLPARPTATLIGG
jgi:hypothetical protein